MPSLKRHVRGNKGWDSLRADNRRYDQVNWSKMRRFLKSKVGKPWSKIYSEISSKHPSWKKWIEFCVELSVYEDGGKIYDSRDMEVISCWRNNFYVLDDILYEAPRRRRKKYKKEKREPKYVIIDNKNFIKQNNVWYRVELKELPDKKPPNFIDAIGIYADSWSDNRWKNNFVYAYGKEVYASKKEQANSREIKKIKEYLNEFFSN